MASAVQLASISRRERNINTSIGSFNALRKHSESARWICIYPAYLNNKKITAEGRRIAIEKACENPTCAEIRDVLQNAGLKVEIEPHKVHPRELNKYELLYRGRVRVQIKNDDETPVKENFSNRSKVMLYAAETIPKLKTRNSQSAKSQSSTQASQETSGKKKKK